MFHHSQKVQIDKATHIERRLQDFDFLQHCLHEQIARLAEILFDPYA